MEILGLVWVASVIHQTSLVADMGADEDLFYQQQPATIDSMASWFASMAQMYGWAVSSSLPTATSFQHNTPSLSWLAPDFSGLGFDLPSSNVQFSPLLPIVKAGLPHLSAQISPSLAEDSTLVSEINQWQNWDAIAAVRVVTSEHTDADNEAALALDRQCFVESSAPFQAKPIAMTAAPKHQVWVHNHFIGEVAGQVMAQGLADKLRTLIREEALNPEQLHPVFGENFVGGSHQGEVLFVVDETMQAHPEIPAAAVAVQWMNNLRVAFEAAPLELVDVQMAMEGLVQTSKEMFGTASWYGPGFHGRQTANGEIFNENALTAAHKTLPFNTHLKVTNRMNGKSVVVRINDRGPYIGTRSLDLSKAAAHCLGSIGKGVIPYEAVILESMPKPRLSELTTAQLPLE